MQAHEVHKEHVVRTDPTEHLERVERLETPDSAENQAIPVPRVLPASPEFKVLAAGTERWVSEVLPECRDSPDSPERPEHPETWDLMVSWVLPEFKEIPDSRVYQVTPVSSVSRDLQAL